MPRPGGLARELAGQRGQLPNLLVALDFDGTLAPIVLDPDAAVPETGGVEALVALADLGAQVAIVTGRSAQTAVRLGALARVPNLIVAGIYGAQLWQNGAVTTVARPRDLASLRARLAAMIAGGAAGLWIEDKALSLVVHTRAAADPAGARDLLAEPVAELAAEYGMVLHRGRHVLEIRLPGYDKGTAVRDLLRRTGRTALLFAGDDEGDLPAFALVKAMRAAGRPAVSVAVTSDEAPREVRDAATYRVGSPAEMVTLLRGLAQQ